MQTIETFRTDRLVAERLSADHLGELLRMNRDPKVMATLGGVWPDEKTERYLSENLEHWERYGFGIWAFRDGTNGPFVARAGLKHTRVGGSDEVELAYALRSEYWGRGLAAELARAAVAVGFERLGLEDIVAFTLPTNRASWRVMEKTGFEYERDVVHAGLPHVLYRMTASDWEGNARHSGPSAFDPRFSTLVSLIPDEIRSHLTGLTGAVSYSTSRSDSVFRLVGEWEGDVYLKVLGVNDAEFNSLRDEAVRLEWLSSRLPVPKVVASGSSGGYEFLLTKSVSGVPANDRSAGWNRQEVASLVGRALRIFHSVPIADCPFRHPVVGPTSKADEVLVHGDYCLTNLLFDADSCHYLDVGEAGVGDRYIDIVAGIWSLRHNYGKGSVRNLLNEYGLKTLDRGKLTAYWRWWNSL